MTPRPGRRARRRATLGLLPADALGDPSQPHLIQFGDGGWSMRRQTIQGDKQRAIERLRAACREALQERSNSRGLTAPGEDAQRTGSC